VDTAEDGDKDPFPEARLGLLAREEDEDEGGDEGDWTGG